MTSSKVCDCEGFHVVTPNTSGSSSGNTRALCESISKWTLLSNRLLCMERWLKDSWKQCMPPAEIGSLSEEASRTQCILQIGIHLLKKILNQKFNENHQPELFCRTFDTWSLQRQQPPLSCKSKYCQRWPSRFRSGICACLCQFPRTPRLIRESSVSETSSI